MSLRRFFLSMLIISPFILFSQVKNGEEFNCFSILAGRDATVDGSVMLAHNEDDYGEQIFNWLVVPAADHARGATIDAHNGAVIPQAGHTHRYIWFDMPGMAFSDSYMNEFGVTIVSNSCPSREDSAMLTDGGITWELRQLMAQRATSARHAVRIAAWLIETYGYAASGRTYSIADPDEAWMLSVVNGKHFVAMRIPDDAVAAIPNYYTITTLNLTDTVNCITSPDIVEYARQRGWYNPETDGQFNFRKAYGQPESLSHPVNIKRMWGAVNSMSSVYYELDHDFPWLINPARKVTVEWLSNILSSHYEGTPIDISDSYTKGHPHHDDSDGICASHTQYGFVAQLRNWMPAMVGSVLWMMPRRPCVQALIPVYCGVDAFPASFTMYPADSALANHFNKPAQLRAASVGHVYWEFSRVADSADSSYLRRIRQIGPEALKYNRQQFLNQEQFELDVLKVWATDPRRAQHVLNQITEKSVAGWLTITREILNSPAPQW